MTVAHPTPFEANWDIDPRLDDTVGVPDLIASGWLRDEPDALFAIETGVDLPPLLIQGATVDHLDLTALTLYSGGHDPGDGEMCLLEAVAYFAREPWTDHPQCVSPILATFGRSWNDALDDTTRQQLKPYIPRMVGTATDGREPERFWTIVDWLIRTYTPPWLRLAGLDADADLLAALPEITGPDQITAARPVIDAARQRAAAAWAAAWTAAWAAAGAAARDAAWDAARDAARDAAGAAAGDAAWAAAGDAARDAAWDAAWDAAGDAARDAAGAAAWDAAGDAAGAAARDAAGDAARAAARDAARDRLKPTVDALQASAFALLGKLCAPAREPVSA